MSAIVGVKCIGCPREEIRDLSLNITLMYIERGTFDVVRIWLDKGIKNKDSSVAAGCVAAILKALREFGTEVVCKHWLIEALPVLLDSRYETVKDRGKALAIELYRWIGVSLKSQLGALEPVQMAELVDEFEKVKGGKAVPTRFIRSEQLERATLAAEMCSDGDPEDDDPSVDIVAKDFDELKLLETPDYGELVWNLKKTHSVPEQETPQTHKNSHHGSEGGPMAVSAGSSTSQPKSPILYRQPAFELTKKLGHSSKLEKDVVSLMIKISDNSLHSAGEAYELLQNCFNSKNAKCLAGKEDLFVACCVKKLEFLVQTDSSTQIEFWHLIILLLSFYDVEAFAKNVSDGYLQCLIWQLLSLLVVRRYQDWESFKSEICFVLGRVIQKSDRTKVIRALFKILGDCSLNASNSPPFTNLLIIYLRVVVEWLPTWNDTDLAAMMCEINAFLGKTHDTDMRKYLCKIKERIRGAELARNNWFDSK